jgi:hypothetical protein
VKASEVHKEAGWLEPLEYMMRVYNDPEADQTRRDRMAVAAAPYRHGRAAEMAPGKKEQANVKAHTAHNETDWASLINAH